MPLGCGLDENQVSWNLRMNASMVHILPVHPADPALVFTAIASKRFTAVSTMRATITLSSIYPSLSNQEFVSNLVPFSIDCIPHYTNNFTSRTPLSVSLHNLACPAESVPIFPYINTPPSELKVCKKAYRGSRESTVPYIRTQLVTQYIFLGAAT